MKNLWPFGSILACAVAAGPALADNPQSTVNVSIEGLALWRDTDDVGLVRADENQAIQLSTGDDDLDWGPGVRLTGEWFDHTGGFFTPGDGMQASAFLVVHNADAGYANNLEGDWTMGDNGEPFWDGADEDGFEDVDGGNYKYETLLTGVELNYLYPIGSGFNFLVGPRFVLLSEDLDIESIDDVEDGPEAFGEVETRNYLFGVQIGVDGRADISEDFFVGGNAKAGVYGNRSHKDLKLVDTSEGLSRFSDESSDFDFSAIFEINGEVGVEITTGAELFIGANFMYIMDVATAPNNFPTSPAANQFIGHHNSEDIIYVGGTAGVRFFF